MTPWAMLLRPVSSESAAGRSSLLPSPVDAFLAMSSLAAVSAAPSASVLSSLPPAASSAAFMLAAVSGSGVASPAVCFPPFLLLALALEVAAAGAAALAVSPSVSASAPAFVPTSA